MKRLIKLLFLTLAFATTGQSQTVLFNLNNATVGGTANTVGSTYTYTGADPGHLYDVVVSLTGMTSNAHLVQPRVDVTSDSITGTDFTSTATTPLLTALWTLEDGNTVANYSASMTFNIKVFNTGTTTLATGINLYGITWDNDGAVDNTSTVREQVTYSGSPTYPSVGSAETQNGNTFIATTTAVNQGLNAAPAYTITALYTNTSTFDWTAAHLVADTAGTDGAFFSRMSALQLGYTPAAVPEPSSSLLALAAVLPFVLGRRKRRQ